MDATLLLIFAALLLLGYALWAVLRELGQAPEHAALQARAGEELVLGERQELAEALLELELGRALGRVDEEDGARVASTLAAPLDDLSRARERSHRLAERCQAVEQELARRLGARPDTSAARSGRAARPDSDSRAAQPSPQAAAAPATGLAAAGAGACPSCGRARRPGDRFCQGCGKRLADACPACGAALPAEARFCKRCGHRVP